MKKLKREDLSNGKVLEALIDRYYANDSKKNLTAVLNCVNDSIFYLPVTIKMKDSDLSLFMQAKCGDTVTINNDMTFAPDELVNANGDKYLPIFTSLSQIPDEYKNKLSIIEKPCVYCIDLAIGMTQLKGIVINGFTQYLAIDKKLFGIITAMPSMLEN